MEATLTVIHNGEEFKFPVKLNKTQIHRLYDATQSNEHACGWEKPEVGQTYTMRMRLVEYRIWC